MILNPSFSRFFHQTQILHLAKNGLVKVGNREQATVIRIDEKRIKIDF